MIDKNKIFNLFMEGTEIKDEKTKKEIKKFMEGPFAKLGMFVKLIQNHQVFHQKLEKFLKHEKPNFNPSKTKEASEYSIYNILFRACSRYSFQMFFRMIFFQPLVPS